MDRSYSGSLVQHEIVYNSLKFDKAMDAYEFAIAIDETFRRTFQYG